MIFSRGSRTQTLSATRSKAEMSIDSLSLIERSSAFHCSLSSICSRASRSRANYSVNVRVASLPRSLPGSYMQAANKAAADAPAVDSLKGNSGAANGVAIHANGVLTNGVTH